ncbi:diacylglycerol kinase family protein [Homoserinimonas sp. OAct 916]|uniref:diacylglycerol/lipid kinase family protein n=1 Tax=Homoserinimonas sp. OAct 916 TaxID=2211450 RepID=UPI000DBEA307|nr:YegS/Rv2252/BmrU family lipid kinase [Homoserinimonas sp. OAct 916]
MTTSFRRLVVIVNPAASFGRNRHVGPQVVSALQRAGHRVTVLEDPDQTRLHDLATAALADVEAPDALIVVGGDGMVSLGTNLLAEGTIPLGIIPTGTGNDMARGLRIPLDDPAAAISALLGALNEPARAIDVGRVYDGEEAVTWFAGVFSAGFDAIVNERSNRMRWPRGRSRYNVALVRELAMLKPIQYRITLDGTQMHTRAMLVLAANNTSIGGGMLVTPEAELDDGLFDVLIVQPLGRLAFLRIFPRVFKGTHITDPRVQIVRARSVRIEADEVVTYADGERVGALPLRVEIRPRALLVLTPPQ